MGVHLRIWNRVFSAFGWARRIALGMFVGAAGDWAETEYEATWLANPKRISTPRNVGHALVPDQRKRQGLMVDAGQMLAVFQRELPLLTEREIRVTSCGAKRSNWRKSTADGSCNVVYDVGIEVDGEPEREIVILGMAPATPELRAATQERGRSLRAHPWTAPFREPAVHLESLGLMLLFFPLDPSLPGLADVTGRGGARVLSRALQPSRGEAGIERIDCELIHYKPFDRAVIKIRATLRDPSEDSRTFYAKFFAGDELESFREYEALWSATRRATWLRLPEPLAYDPARRMLVMSEAAGERELNEWIRRIERGDPLPPGVGVERLEECARVAARALGELQRSGVRPKSQRMLRDDLERLKSDRDLLRGGALTSWPDLAAGADGLIERMELLARADERLVPAHGAYRHKQMIGDERSLTVVDWDGLSLANHALDAATFLGRLRREPSRRPGSTPELERMAMAFRRAFLDESPEAERDLDLYESLQLTEEVLRSLRRHEDGDDTVLGVRNLIGAADLLLQRVETRDSTA
jgi:hypothetical protein